MHIIFYCLLYTILYCFVFSGETFAQGPYTQYYYNPLTELSWADCFIYLQGGSSQKIPFLPVIVGPPVLAPTGTNRYTTDVAVDGSLVFIGNGIVRNGTHDSYSNLDVNDKVVMFCYDSPDSIATQYGEEYPLNRRLENARARGALGVVVFSLTEPYPFPALIYEESTEIPTEIPAITITRETAGDILASAGKGRDELFTQWAQTCNPPVSEELIVNIQWRFEGAFEQFETEHFNIAYRRETLDSNEMAALIELNERASAYLLGLFEPEQLTWKKTLTVYFRDYDSKIFYTRHWGRGFASSYIVLMVYHGVPDYGLAVHENTHNLIDSNWGGSSSFMSEGIAMYAEACATESAVNHRKTLEFMRSGDLYPFGELLEHQIGRQGMKTTVGYPASGSFVDYLITTYGLPVFKKLYQRGATDWEDLYGTPLDDLVRDWHHWLEDNFSVPK